MHMLIFGLVWTAFISFFVYMMFFVGGGPIEVNGVLMSQEEAAKQPVLIIFFGVFFAVGIFMIIKGAKSIIKNKITNSKGTETYGIILDIHGTGTKINGRPELAADILTVINGSQTEVFTEVIGLKSYKYRIGDYLKLKHYDNDVNIVAKIQETEIPAYVFEILQRESRGFVGISSHMDQSEYPYMPNNLYQTSYLSNHNNFNSFVGQQPDNKSIANNQYDNSHNLNNNLNENDNEIIINGKIYKKQ